MAGEYISDFEDTGAGSESMAVTVPDTGVHGDLICVVIAEGAPGDVEPGILDDLSWDNGSAVDFTLIVEEILEPAEAIVIGGYYMTSDDGDWPGDGAKTLYWSPDGTVDIGFNISVSFYKNINISGDPIVDTDSRQFGGNWTSGLGGVAAGDMGILGAHNDSQASDTTGNGQTEIADMLNNSAGLNVAYEVGEDALIASAEGSSDLVGIAFALLATVAGPAPTAALQGPLVGSLGGPI